MLFKTCSKIQSRFNVFSRYAHCYSALRLYKTQKKLLKFFLYDSKPQQAVLCSTISAHLSKKFKEAIRK